MTQAHLGLQDITDPRFRSVCEQIISRMEQYQVPGVSVGILCDGIEYTAGLGVTNLEHPLPVTTKTLFQIGSTTKTFTAIAVMRLVEQGKIDLDTPIRTYLPELKLADPTVAEHVTMRHLLTHTAGWLGDHFLDTGWGDDALAKYVASLEKIEQLTPLGEVWSYNNAGFNLAGRVIEAVTGKVYETALKELVLEPLGLKNSYFFMQEVMNLSFATGHKNEVGTNKASIANPWPIPRSANPAGAIVADVHDQLKYARFVMGDGSAEDGAQVLKKETLELMRTPQVNVGGGLADYVGFSFLLRHVDGVVTVGHGGATHGQKSAFETIPSKQFAIIIMTNADNGGPLHREMIPLIYETFLGLKEPAATNLKLPPEKIAEYVGSYKAHGSTLVLTVDEDCRLVINYQIEPDPESKEPAPQIPPVHAEFTGEDRILLLDPPLKEVRCDFIRGPQNEIQWLRFGGRIARRL